MEESKNLQTLYKVFRTFIYVSLIVEFFEYAINPDVLDHWGGILVEIHDRLKLLDVYQNDHLLHSKVMTLLIICITCIGTRNKKHLEFNAKKMVIYPISIGIVLMFLSVWVFYQHWTPNFFTLYSSTWLYFFMSIVGTILCQIALDNISKYLKDGLLLVLVRHSPSSSRSSVSIVPKASLLSPTTTSFQPLLKSYITIIR